MRRIIIIAMWLALLSAGVRYAVGRQTGGWIPISLQPIQQFSRLSQAGDIDEGTYSSYNSFLSVGYRLGEDIGLPGIDAAIHQGRKLRDREHYAGLRGVRQNS